MAIKICLHYCFFSPTSHLLCSQGTASLDVKDHRPWGSLTMFVKAFLGESGRFLLQPQQEEPRGCAVGDGTVQNLKGKKDKIKQETGYMNIVCQLSSLKKVTIRGNVSWLYCVRIQTLCQLPSWRLQMRMKGFLKTLGFPQNLVIVFFEEVSWETSNQTTDQFKRENHTSRKMSG